MTVVAWRNYPKKWGGRIRRAPFRPLKGWNRGFFGMSFIRVGGRRHPERLRFQPRLRVGRRTLKKRINWLAIADDLRRSRKRHADRKAGRLPPFPQIEVMWDTPFVIRLLDQ